MFIFLQIWSASIVGRKHLTLIHTINITYPFGKESIDGFRKERPQIKNITKPTKRTEKTTHQNKAKLISLLLVEFMKIPCES